MCNKRRLECIYTPANPNHESSPKSTGSSTTHRHPDGLAKGLSTQPTTTSVAIASAQPLHMPWLSVAPEPQPLAVEPVTMQTGEARPAKRHCKLYEVRDDEAEADADSRDSCSSSIVDTSALWQSRMIETSEDRGRVSKSPYPLLCAESML